VGQTADKVIEMARRDQGSDRFLDKIADVQPQASQYVEQSWQV
jgi:hypothetical protein